jgi:D-sedoheptulose 7-phosphate isomerase
MHPALKDLILRYPDLEACSEAITKAFELLVDSYRNKGKLLVCGNGGSASDSEHIVGELMKGFMCKRPVQPEYRNRLIEMYPEDGEYIASHLQGALPAISLVSHTSLTSAFINDQSADLVYAQQVYGYGRKGDSIIGISTSGNSKNVVFAIKVAKSLGLRTIGFTGKTGGKLGELCDVTIKIPYDSTPVVQERHLPVYHTLCIMLEQEFFKE